MIVDEFDDLSVRTCTPSRFKSRLSWDIYRLISAKMWSKFNDEGLPVCEPFKIALNSKHTRFYLIEVLPSRALFSIHTADDVDISKSQAITSFMDYVEQNMSWFNGVKLNDFREPMERPIDPNILTSRRF